LTQDPKPEAALDLAQVSHAPADLRELFLQPGLHKLLRLEFRDRQEKEQGIWA
jgi:hypothetical protein